MWFLVIRSLSGRNISQFSSYPTEKEVTFLPYTYFRVVKYEPGTEQFGQHVKKLYLEELPSPRLPRCVFWVDDNPQNNVELAHEIDD